MAWIELHDTLPDHKKVLAVATALKADKDLIVGKLVRLWVWALNNREDGRFSEQDVATIAEIMRFRGKPQKLITALLDARLLDYDGCNYMIHDWDERVGMLLAKREASRSQARDRQRRRRDRQRDASDTCHADVTRDKTDCHAATVPKPYHTDDDDDGEDDTARAYAEAERVVAASYRAAFGRDATTAEVAAISRTAVLNNKVAIIGHAIDLAAVFGVKAVVKYVNRIVRDWVYYHIDSPDELGEYDYLQDCAAGRLDIGYIDPQEALERLKAHRERKIQEAHNAQQC